MITGKQKVWMGAGVFFALWCVTWMGFAFQHMDVTADRLTFIALSIASAVAGRWCFKRSERV